MQNAELAEVFHGIAELLGIQGGDPHRIRAFQRAAHAIAALPTPAADRLAEGTLGEVPGLGPGSVRRVEALLRTGTCDVLEGMPAGLRELLALPGLGPRTVGLLVRHGIDAVDVLEAALEDGRALALPRFGPRRVEALRAGIGRWRAWQQRVPWIRAHRAAQGLVQALEGAGCRVEVAGGIRRGQAEVPGVELVAAAAEPAGVLARFVTLPQVEAVLGQEPGQVLVRLGGGLRARLRAVDPGSFGSALWLATGSEAHARALRAHASARCGIDLDAAGQVAGQAMADERDLFAALGLPPIPPELREGRGELEAAQNGRLARPLGASDLRGDLHMHTVASDGRGTVEAMAVEAHRLGHDYLAITDHTRSLTVAQGLDAPRLRAQIREVRDTEQRLGRIRILAGTEVDALPDGTLDLGPEVLGELDWVIASAHLGLGGPGSALTDRYIAAMETGLVDCIGHPTTRRLGERDGAELDLDRLFAAARRLDVALEINGNPYRMDLPAAIARRAIEAGVRLCLNTDAHAPEHLARQEYGLLTARRAGVQPADLLNARPVEELLARRRARRRTHGVALSWPAPPADGAPDPSG